MKVKINTKKNKIPIIISDLEIIKMREIDPAKINQKTNVILKYNKEFFTELISVIVFDIILPFIFKLL